MTTEGVYRINKAGAWVVGHFNLCEIRLDLGRPKTCRVIPMTTGQAVGLMRCLGVDFEDGAYMADALEGQNILVVDGEDGGPLFLGDPYGNKSIDLREDGLGGY